jgi:hypothetical protein
MLTILATDVDVLIIHRPSPRFLRRACVENWLPQPQIPRKAAPADSPAPRARSRITPDILGRDSAVTDEKPPPNTPKKRLEAATPRQSRPQNTTGELRNDIRLPAFLQRKSSMSRVGASRCLHTRAHQMLTRR